MSTFVCVLFLNYLHLLNVFSSAIFQIFNTSFGVCKFVVPLFTIGVWYNGLIFFYLESILISHASLMLLFESFVSFQSLLD